MMPTISDRLKCVLAEIHDLDCTPSNEVYAARSTALKQQLNDLISVLAERGFIKCEKN